MIKILVFADIVEKGRFEIWLENQTNMLKKDFIHGHYSIILAKISQLVIVLVSLILCFIIQSLDLAQKYPSYQSERINRG